MLRSLRALVCIALWALTPVAGTGQSTQALIGTTNEIAESERELIAVMATGRLILYELAAADTSSAYLKSLWDIRARAAARLLEARHDPEAFDNLALSYLEVERSITERWAGLLGESVSFDAQANPVPQISILHPDVVFSVGPELSLTKDQTPAYDLGLSSNLLGAAAGTAFDVIGASDFATYLKENISVGAAFPIVDDSKITAQLGIGLGALNVGSTAVWPVLNVEQIDATDSRLPGGIGSGQEDAAQWSVPILSFGWVHDRDWFGNQLSSGELAYVLVVGFRLPFFYPGDVFETVGAVFSESRADFVRGGSIGLDFGIAVPLLKVEAGT